MSINKINDAINRTSFIGRLISLSPTLRPSSSPLSLLLAHSMSSCRYPRVDGNKKKKITDRFYIKKMVRKVVALARGSSMKNVAVYIPSPLGIDTLYTCREIPRSRMSEWLIGFSKLYLLFPGVSGRKTLSWSEVDSLMHLYNATFFFKQKKRKENRNTLCHFRGRRRKEEVREQREKCSSWIS